MHNLISIERELGDALNAYNKNVSFKKIYREVLIFM